MCCEGTRAAGFVYACVDCFKQGVFYSLKYVCQGVTVTFSASDCKLNISRIDYYLSIFIFKFSFHNYVVNRFISQLLATSIIIDDSFCLKVSQRGAQLSTIRRALLTSSVRASRDPLQRQTTHVRLF